MTKRPVFLTLALVAACFDDPSSGDGAQTASGSDGGSSADTTTRGATSETGDSTASASSTSSTETGSSTSSGPDSSSDTDDVTTTGGDTDTSPSSSTGSVLPDPDLWYPFDGNAYDMAGDADGVEVGDLGYVAGYDGLAVDLRPFNHYINASAFGSEFLAANDSITIAMRLWPQAYHNLDNIITLTDGADDGLHTNSFRIRAMNGEIEVFTETEEAGTDHVAYLGPLPSTSSWHGVVFVFDNGVAKVFVDGALQEVTDYVPAETTCEVLRIGGPWEQYEGLMDDLRIYLLPLSDEQAAELSSS